MKKYRVANNSHYNKRLIFGRRTELIQAKSSVELSLTPQEVNIAKRSEDIIVSEATGMSEHVKDTMMIPEPSPTENKSRPLYEHLMVEIFQLKSVVARLEARLNSLEGRDGR